MIKDIYTIWFRHIKKSLKDKWQILIAIFWIMLIIFVFGFGIDSFIQLKNYDVSFTELLGPGMIAIIVMSGALSVGNDLIEDKKGFMKELLVSPISRASIFTGLIIGNITVNLLMTMIVVILFLSIIASVKLSVILLSIMIMSLIAFGFYGLGIILASFFNHSKSFQRISNLINGLIVLLSGAFYPINNLPTAIKWIVTINPLAYGVDALRNVMINYSEYSLTHSLTILILFGLITLIVGSQLFKKMLNK